MSYDPNNPYANQQQVSSLADQAALTAYANARSQNLSDQIALEQAKLAWTKVVDSANLSGMFEGAPTWSVDQALGVAPKAAGGGPLLTQQDMYGNSGGSAGGGTNTMAMDALLGNVGGTPTLAAMEAFGGSGGAAGGGTPTLGMVNSQNQAEQAYLDLLSKLQGPANAFQYAKVLAGTPQGLTDIVNAAAGRLHIPASGGYNLGGSATPTSPPMGAASGGVVGGGVATVPGMAHPVAVGPDGTLSSAGAASGGNLASPTSLIGAANNPGAYQPPATGALPLPNQIDPTAWARFDPSQKALLQGAYQNDPNNPINPDDLNAAFTKSLPAYRGAQRGGIAGLWQ